MVISATFKLARAPLRDMSRRRMLITGVVVTGSILALAIWAFFLFKDPMILILGLTIALVAIGVTAVLGGSQVSGTEGL